MANEFTAPVTIIRNEITAPITQARDAYQLALAEGFVGTRAQWLASLAGTANVAEAIHAATAVSAPADADELGLTLSPSWLLRKLTFANLKTWILAFLTDGSDALTPSDIGAATAVAPQFTGAAVFGNAINPACVTIYEPTQLLGNGIEIDWPKASGTIALTQDMYGTIYPSEIGAAPINPVRHVFWPAGAMIPRTSTAPAAATIDSGTHHHMQDVYDFDSATAEYGCFVGCLEHWNASTIKCKPVWKSSTSAGDVVWGFQARAYADGDAIDQAFGTAQTSTDTTIAAGNCQVGPATAAITVAGTPANGQRISLQVYRDAAAGLDTLAADARLIGVWIEYQESDTEEAAWT